MRQGRTSYQKDYLRHCLIVSSLCFPSKYNHLNETAASPAFSFVYLSITWTSREAAVITPDPPVLRRKWRPSCRHGVTESLCLQTVIIVVGWLSRRAATSTKGYARTWNPHKAQLFFPLERCLKMGLKMSSVSSLLKTVKVDFWLKAHHPRFSAN